MTHYIYKCISFSFYKKKNPKNADIRGSVFDVMNNFIKMVTAKSNDFKSRFGNEKHSKP